MLSRGDIYWVNLGSGFKNEKGVTRPAVVVAREEVAKGISCVMMALMSTKKHNTTWEVYTEGAIASTGKGSYVQCNNVNTYDQDRICGYIGKLSSEELRKVEDVLEEIFDLGYNDDDVKEAEIAAKDEEIARLTAALAEARGANAEQLRAASEAEVIAKQMYNEVLKRLVEKSVEVDVLKGMLEAKTTKTPEAPIVEDPVPVILDIQRLDINKCSAKELIEIGMSSTVAYRIVRDRKSNGSFRSVFDITRITGIGQNTVNKYHDLLTT